VTKLARLKPQFLDLPYPLRLTLILELRANRRVSKRPPPTPKKTTKRSIMTVGKKDAARMVSAITPEMAMELLALLGSEVPDDAE
jgi:hypothetical protein